MAHTLQKLFYDPNVPKAFAHDLSIPNFISRIMIPETAILLAQEDLGLDRDGAHEVLLKGREYGSVMHPDDED